MLKLLLVVVALVGLVAADVYVHNPRGSNNRLNEKSANRQNGNRLFDSQNNNRGGYNVGDKTDQAFLAASPTGTIAQTFDETDLDTAMQYQMVYLEGSKLPIEWTNQHGCGGNEEDDPHKLNCQLVIQYMCDSADSVTDEAMTVNLRDGGNTNTPTAPGLTKASLDAAVAANNAGGHGGNPGRQESEAHYLECQLRERNKGLFTADQNLRGNSAKYTRQNPGGTRRGLECPEERDYYPYWHPSPWRDVAVFTSDIGKCEWYQEESQNVKGKGKCVDTSGQYTAAIIAANTQEECEALEDANAEWQEFKWDLDEPHCDMGDWSRVNHLGNGVDGQPLMYNWTLPSITELQASGAKIEDGMARCVLRFRYNISTDDYDPWNTTSEHNQNLNANPPVRSPVEQNPVVNVDAQQQGLRLAINTAQFGRTFQDRSHVFYVKQTPTRFRNANIHNLNVRGKRGNIVQTFPAVEYDFQPNRMHVSRNDYIHIQWTGSNTHNNGNPAGDGQAGDAGEGRGGTDRHNMVPAKVESESYPIPLDTAGFDTERFLDADNIDCFSIDGTPMSFVDCALTLATSGYYRSESDIAARVQLNPLLNNAPASLVNGVVIKFKSRGDFHYLCTRNNNFSNRAQKGSIVVDN